MHRSKVDLHVHSTTSDGDLSPSEVVRYALSQGLIALALTDHDTLGGIAEAQRAAEGADLDVIPGTEINSKWEGGALHLLGYYVDPDHPVLKRRLQRMRNARLDRAHAMLDRLEDLGLPMDWEDVDAMAQGQSMGRPHIARALLNRGYVDSIQEAFDRYISPGGAAYVPRLRLTPGEVIESIHAAGGVAVLAHPGPSGAVDIIPRLVSLGLQGLEVYYPRQSSSDVQLLLDLCQRYGLIATGGSDFHAEDHEEGATLGSVFVPVECIEELRRVAGR